MAKENENQEIRVEDRRFFDKDGNPVRQEEEPSKTESTPSQNSEPMQEKPPHQRESAQRKPSGPPLQIDFASFLMIYLQTALIHLGELEDSVEKKPQINLEAARQIIDILDMLKEKTRGNLTQEEERYLESMLFDLRMRYVEKAKKPK
jgi:hypothetical protein